MRFITIILFLYISMLQANPDKELEKVSLQLHWKYQFQFAGFIAAKEMGFYEDVGLDVELKEFKNKTDIIKDVVEQKSTYGIYNSNILLKYLQGTPLVLVASYFKRAALVIITSPDISSIQELKGKTIMAGDSADFALNFQSLLDSNNMSIDDINLVKHSYNIEDFSSKKVDAMTAFISDQPYKLTKQEIKYNIINPSDLGLYNLQLELFTSHKESMLHPHRVLKMRDATAKGWEYALSHKDEIIDIILQKYSPNIPLDILKNEAKEIEKLILPKTYVVGSIDSSFLKKQKQLLSKTNNITKNNSLPYFIFRPQNRDRYFLHKELEYIKKKGTIKVCYDKTFYPYTYDDNGIASGISVDILKLVSKYSGITLEFVQSQEWSNQMQNLQNNLCEMVAVTMSKPNHYDFLTTTDSYIEDDLVLITRINEPYISSLLEVKHKIVGIKYGFKTLKKHLESIYPDIVLKEIKDQPLKQVKDKKIYAFISMLTTTNKMIAKDYETTLKVMGKVTDKKVHGAFGVKNSETALLSILNKTLKNIPAKEIDEIYSSWHNLKFEKSFYEKQFTSIMVVSLVIMGIFLLFLLLLRRSNKHLKQLLDTTNNAIVVFENGKVVDVNDVCLKMFRYDNLSQILGREAITFVAKKDLALLKKNFEHSVDSYEINLLDRYGNIVSVLAKGTNISSTRRISSFIDLSELKNKEKELEMLNISLEEKVQSELSKNREKDKQMQEQNRLAQMGEMLSMIAHQWRQPLTAINAASHLLTLKLEIGSLKDEDIKAVSAKIASLSTHLSETIDDFRDFYKSDKTKVYVGYTKLIDGVLRIMDTSLIDANIKVVKDLHSEVKFNTYQNELRQVIINLIKNAEDVLIENNIQNPTIEIISKANILSICDNGGGVREDILDKVFDPYFSTKSKNGTGLGLYMSKQIIEDHCEGKLSVSNNESGAIFTIELKLPE